MFAIEKYVAILPRSTPIIVQLHAYDDHASAAHKNRQTLAETAQK